MKTLTIIPSRLSATRLPGKPLLKINDLSIISHVFRRAQEANIGDVVVAAEDQEIVDDVIKNGGRAILTGKNHKTGTDRIYEALRKLELKDVDFIMNLQGDEPAINIEDIISLNKKMVSNQSNMGTLAAKMKDLKDLDNENIVKVITSKNLNNQEFSQAKNFLRTSREIDNIYHHIGIYCYSTETLKKFVRLNQSKNEIENRLEQLRALDNNIDINVALAASSPIGIDTEEDYLALKKIMEYKV
ncbi:3-deoxy-manno-octulosonate cytidylyltransferase [Candidatus Pelagibacter sp.]|nr:3-deoxy-manno-octulosonate cytidylyltransferase [Candidatus Pelagibacter sp.]MDB4812133.1 3-deoxy-manno-octulosonate cytidylyltransferase [Candidatus Pelagibacter sp.]MDC0466137.1 3-deoxy-manno-octulosonate cytidylyltransferase [Candidatus Pelagibacter sp.]